MKTTNMASTDGPEAEFDNPRRKALLGALKDALLTDTVQPTAWACLWLSDIGKLEDLVTLSKTTPYAVKFILEGVEVSVRLVPTWTQRKRLSSAASTPENPGTPLRTSTPPHPPLVQHSSGKKRNSNGQLLVSRSKPQADQCRQRDQRKCILINAGEPIEVAHIYPYSMRYEDDTIRQQLPTIWDTLRVFWSQERIDAWYNAIFSHPAKTEACQNLLCLSPNAHAYWERAYFALKPIAISDDKKHLDVQFFWLLSNPHVPGINILRTPLLSTRDHGPNLSRLSNHETMSPICSGDIISLETDDPVTRPLPDFNLLEMQWILHRVTAMSGAAEPQDDFHDEDDNNDIMLALQNRLDMYTEGDWDMETEELPTKERFEQERSFAQSSEVHTFRHMVILRGGGHRERENHGGEDYEGENCEEEGDEEGDEEETEHRD